VVYISQKLFKSEKIELLSSFIPNKFLLNPLPIKSDIMLSLSVFSTKVKLENLLYSLHRYFSPLFLLFSPIPNMIAFSIHKTSSSQKEFLEFSKFSFHLFLHYQCFFSVLTQYSHLSLMSTSLSSVVKS
jgi:hypothetical protein